MSYWQAVVFPLVVVAVVFFSLGLMVGNHRGYVRAVRRLKEAEVRALHLSSFVEPEPSRHPMPDRYLDRTGRR